MPNWVFGRYRATPPTLNEGDIEGMLLDAKGNLRVSLFDSLGQQQATFTAANDSVSGGINGIRALALGMFWNGSSWDRARTPNVFKIIQNTAVTAGTPVAVWTPAASKKFRLMGFMLSLSVAGRILLKDNGTEIMRTGDLAAAVGMASPVFGNGILSSAANQALQVDASASGSVNGFVFGTEE